MHPDCIRDAGASARALTVALRPWHDARPKRLASLMSRPTMQKPVVAAIARRILPLIPRGLRGSSNIKSVGPAVGSPHSFVGPMEQMIHLPHVSFDHRDYRNTLAFDLDHADGIDLVLDMPPHLRPWLIVDPWSGYSAAIYFLAEPVCMRQDASRRPQALARHAQDLLCRRLRASPIPFGVLHKNPLGLASELEGTLKRRTPKPSMPALFDAWKAAKTSLLWHIIPGANPVTLTELFQAFATPAEQAAIDAEVAQVEQPAQQPPPRRRPARGRRDGAWRAAEASTIGRNNHLFDRVRSYAYSTGESRFETLYAYALSINAPGYSTTPKTRPLSDAAVRSVARSVARFMRDRFGRTGPAPDRRQRDRDVPLTFTSEQRQAVAGQRSAAARRSATDAKIADALARMRAAGIEITKARLAAEAEVSVNTIRARWAALQQQPGAEAEPDQPTEQQADQPPAETCKSLPARTTAPPQPTARPPARRPSAQERETPRAPLPAPPPNRSLVSVSPRATCPPPAAARWRPPTDGWLRDARAEGSA